VTEQPEEYQATALAVPTALRPKVLTPTFVLLVMSVMLNGLALVGIVLMTSDTNRVVADIERRTSPAAQAETQKQVEQIIERIAAEGDCRTRQAIEEAVNALSAQIGFAPVDVTQACR
jgi:hypothetical protein